MLVFTALFLLVYNVDINASFMLSSSNLVFLSSGKVEKQIQNPQVLQLLVNLTDIHGSLVV